MTDPDSAASPSDERGRTLAQFPLSRVTEVFHDEMLGVLPPATFAARPASSSPKR
jgi:hypothetical protein